MKVVIQRVTQACVTVNEEVISSIKKGLLVLVGISENDAKEDVDFISRKLLNIKFFDDENGKRWSKSVMDQEYEILCVSQFTLCYNLKGNRLDFHRAMKPVDSEKFYESFLECLRKQYRPEMIKDGKFGALMKVNIHNDGPVTINLESPGENKKADHKFFCEEATKFNQRSRTCQAEEVVDCNLSSRYYHLNENFLIPKEDPVPEYSFEPSRIKS